MSDLGIFSLLVVGRNLPPAFLPTSGADYRPVDRSVPVAEQRRAFRAKQASEVERADRARGPGSRIVS